MTTRACTACPNIYRGPLTCPACGATSEPIRGSHIAKATGIPERTAQLQLKGQQKMTASSLRDYCLALLDPEERTGPVWSMVSHFAEMEDEHG